MPVKYEWKVQKNGTRKFVRTFVAEAPPAPAGTGQGEIVIEAPDEPVVAKAVAVPSTPKKAAPRRRRKTAPKTDG